MYLRNKALAPWIDNRYGLVSLWDIMRPFRVNEWLGFFRALGKTTALNGDEKLLSQDDKDRWVAGDEDFQRICNELGLRASVKTLQRLSELLSRDDVTQGQVNDHLEEFVGRVEDEMESELFLHVGGGEARYYQDWAHGWQSVLGKFPSTAFDIEEAGKCLALSRGTGSVFHLMRVLEAGLNALAAELGVPFTRRNWGTIIDRIEPEIRKRSRAGPGPKANAASKKAWKSEIEFYSEAAVQFTYFKEAWRNRTAHTGTVYTEEKAESIYQHVREFMQHLSTKLAEPPS